jgi:hypothetical protein
MTVCFQGMKMEAGLAAETSKMDFFPSPLEGEGGACREAVGG